MEFILILFFHFIGNFILQPIWISNRTSSNVFFIIIRSIIYGLSVYLLFPIFILIIQTFSGLSMSEFLITYELSNLIRWNFSIFIFILLGYLSIDIWTHRLSLFFHRKYVNSKDYKWEYLSICTKGLDQLLHVIHLYIIYNIVFM